IGPDQSYQRWPRFLPDGRHFIYLVTGKRPEASGVFVASIDGMQPKLLLSSASNAEYAPPGYLLFRLDDALMAQPFNSSTLELSGQPVPIVPSLAVAGNGRVGVSASSTGYLAYIEGGGGRGTTNQLTWFDRSGKQLDSVGPPAVEDNVR